MKIAWALPMLGLALACTSSGPGSGGSTSGGPGSQSSLRICQKLQNLPCPLAPTVADCVSFLEAERSEASQGGCGTEYDALLSCAANHPLYCEGADAVPDPACDSQLQSFEQCADVKQPPPDPPTGG
jgi:hypothetical protein